MTHDRRTFLRAFGATGIGLAAAPLVTARAAAAELVTMEGGGYDIWSTRDEFHFYYAEVTGDFDVTVHNPYVEDTHEFAKGGIMARETFDEDAKNVMLRHLPSGDASLQWRPGAGEDTVSTTSGGEDESEVSGGSVNADWLRLTRDGDAFAAYASDDGGDNWTLIADLNAGNLTMSDTLYVGLPVTSHDTGTLATAEYWDLSGLSPTQNRDIGDPEVAGSVTAREGIPVVTTEDATDVGATGATLHARLSDFGEASSADIAFEYRESGAESWSRTDAETRSEPGDVSIKVSGLTPQTAYEYRAVVEASDGDAYEGDVASFETPSVVSIESVDDIDARSATFTGSADLIGISEAETYFEYRELNAPDWTATDATTITESGTFTADTTDLISRRYIEVRAVIEADDVDPVTSDALVFSTPSRSNSKGKGPRGPPSASQFDPDDGWASTDWVSDDTPVVIVREPTREQLATALHVDGERIVAFETSGTIDLEGGIGVHNDRFWIAGQTAPSPGITLARGGVHVDADDFVIQHVRVRRGDDTPESGAGDAVGTAEDRENGVFDHVTATWGTDETLSAYGQDITISNSIIAEALRNSDFHEGGNGHSAGSLIGAGYERFAMLGNVWASNLTRNPRLQSGTSVVVNNVSYDFENAINCSSETTSSIVGNAYIRGDVNGAAITMFDPHEGEIYAADNYTRPEAQDVVGDDVNLVDDPPVWPDGLEVLSANETESHVLRHAGARPADRTYHDRRIIRNVANWEAAGDHLPGGSGFDHAWIDHEEIVGGYPELSENTRSLNVPQSGTRAWLGSHARRVELPRPKGYHDEDGPGVVDDFEDGDLDEYVGTTGHYEVTADDPVAEGEYSLKNVTDSDALISSLVDLPRYPQAGDTVAAKVAPTDETGVVGIAFGVVSHENFYFVRYWPDVEGLQLYKVEEDEWSTPNYDKLAESGSFSLETGEIYEFVLDWGTDGSIDIELRDPDGAVIESVSATDDTHLWGGFGTRRTGMLDDVRILDE